MRVRRTMLVSGVAVLCALAARRAHALRDPSELSVGGSTGQHDAHIACGPDIRVRHASAGLSYERLFQAEHGPEGRGASIAVRAGAGMTTITRVSDVDPTKPDARATLLDRNETGSTHWLGSGAVALGYDWRTFALRGGVGYFGFSSLTSDNQHFVAKYYPLPVIDMRIGQTTGFRGELGVGAPPIPGLARWYAIYGFLAYRFKEGGEFGAGHVTAFGGTLDQRMGFLFKGSFPLHQRVHVGGFGMVDADDKSKLSGFNWTAGGGVTFLLDDAE